MSLITADNNADISHTQGDAGITILPDPGASGTVMIMPEHRRVYIGEPTLIMLNDLFRALDTFYIKNDLPCIISSTV